MPKTHEEHVRRVKHIHGDRLVVAGRYTHSLVKVEYSCPQHGMFSAWASNIEAGGGCRVCANERHSLTQEEHDRRVTAACGDHIKALDPYVGANTKIRYICKYHGVFSTKPAAVWDTRGVVKYGCALCAAARGHRQKSYEAYAAEIAAHGLSVIGRYTGAHGRLRYRCALGHEWEAVAYSVAAGHGCPLCDQSQYRRRAVTVGTRTVLVQGSEGLAIACLIREGVIADDLAFTSVEGRPTFRYVFGGRSRVYVPDMFRVSTRTVIEVKGAVTCGLFDETLFEMVCAKSRAVVVAGFDMRLMLIHRRRNIELDYGWYSRPWVDVVDQFRRKSHAQDLRYRREHGAESRRYGNASSALLAER